MATKYTEEMLRDAVAHSVSFAGAVRFLGLVETGGTHVHISRRIKALGIDTSHFTGQAWAKGLSRPRQREPREVLVLYDAGTPRVRGDRLRAALLQAGRPYVCVSCGIAGQWLLQPLTLHVDHIDGNYMNCTPGNLRFLCPNCHSQTPTHAGKNKRRLREARQLEFEITDEEQGARGGTRTPTPEGTGS